MGTDIKTVQIGWPLGMPLVRKMAADLWEIRSRFSAGIARVLFTVVRTEIVLLHGFIKKSEATPLSDLALARKRHSILRGDSLMNKHVGSDFDEFLQEEALLEEVTAAALKRVVAWQISELMKAQRVSKSALAQRMQTSRTVVARVLDSDDAGLTLATLANAARALGQRVEIRFVPENRA